MAPQLTDYPRPNVAVDLAVLSVEPTDEPTSHGAAGRLVTLALARRESPAGHVLPGRFMRERETIQQTVETLLVEKLQLSPSLGGVTPRLLRIFDDPSRDERAWTLSIAQMVALPWEYVGSAPGEWLPVDTEGRLARRRHLLFDHDTILRESVASMRDRYETDPDPDRLLAGPFTLLELRRLHEAVLGEPIRKDTFNRRMRPQLVATDEEPATRSVGRPAQHYRPPERRSDFSDSLWRLPRAAEDHAARGSRSSR